MTIDVILEHKVRRGRLPIDLVPAHKYACACVPARVRAGDAAGAMRARTTGTQMGHLREDSQVRP